MASYSVATVQEQLPELIDRLLAGEEVVIAREGAPAVELRVVEDDTTEQQRRNVEDADVFRRHLERMPKNTTPYLEGKYQEEKERGY